MNDVKTNATQAILAVYVDHEKLAQRVAELETFSELWCVCLSTTGDLLAMGSRAYADKYSASIEGLGIEGMTADVVSSPWPLDVHMRKAFATLDGWLNTAEEHARSQDAYLRKLHQVITNLRATPENNRTSEQNGEVPPLAE